VTWDGRPTPRRQCLDLRGRATPAPAQETRDAFSFMSPAAGHATTGTPHASARTSVPWPAWSTTAEQSGIVCAYESQSTSRAFAGTSIGTVGSRRFVVASTRTGSSASPSSAARSIRCSGSWAVEGATSTSGALPGGGSTGPNGCSHISGPVTRTQGSSGRGYSSCGKVATSASSWEIPPCTWSSGGSPTRPRESFSCSRPCSSPPFRSGSHCCHIQRPAPVRGSRAPIEYGGKPGEGVGRTCGMSVAQGRSCTSAAKAAATVRMSATTASGPKSSISAPVTDDAFTAAW
jgi:hypothetical protein